MDLKIVHINKLELQKDAEAKAFWENVLKPKWEEQARERGAKLLAELKGKQYASPNDSPVAEERNKKKGKRRR